MKLIVGLGNPGKKYRNTRHNIGFMVLDGLLGKLTPVGETVWQQSKKFNSLIAKIDDIILVKPQTFMNASGIAVAKIASYYHIEPVEIWVVHDEVDLPLGKIRIRKGGGTAGHRGLESIIEQLGTGGFVRFRLGIGHPREVAKSMRKREKLVEKYVLSRFSLKEKSAVKQMVKKGVKAIQLALDEGLERAMNQFN
ncbi:hypothetical protein AMJ51_00100 [Microgenomates bacterium DG_75]|nr:MAG: hypothetical protein AMJ51_00100 [Microgenomates bacterium DG_75]